MHLRRLHRELNSVKVPRWGSVSLYTKAIGAWAPPLVPDKLIDKQTAISGESSGTMPDYLFKQSEYGCRKDAECQLACHYASELGLQTGGAPGLLNGGTLYFCVSRGPCRSCRNVLKALARQWGIRIVVSYAGVRISPGTHSPHGSDGSTLWELGWYYDWNGG